MTARIAYFFVAISVIVYLVSKPVPQIDEKPAVSVYGFDKKRYDF